MPRPLDLALSRLHRYSAVYKDALASHGPMAAEALEAMGLRESIPAFVSSYEPILEPFVHDEPASDDWRDGIGDPDAHRWLTAVFHARIERAGVDQVARDVVAQLLPGLAGGAFHGLIRAGHALRGHRRHPGPTRATEVAHALAYWASAFQVLPGTPGAASVAGNSAAKVLETTPLVDQGDRLSGLIARRFGPLMDSKAFRGAVESFDPRAQAPAQSVVSVARFGASSYSHATTGRDRFTYLHVTTASAALLTVLDWLSDDEARAAAGYLVRAAAAIHSTHGHTQDPGSALPDALTRDEIATRSAASLDDHAIKFAEACLRLARTTPEFGDTFLAAASAAVVRAKPPATS